MKTKQNKAMLAKIEHLFEMADKNSALLAGFGEAVDFLTEIGIKKIAENLKNENILFLVDGAQSAGQIEVDINELECDFYSIPGQKWIMGPEGTGAIYVKKELIDKLLCINAGYRSI